MIFVCALLFSCATNSGAADSDESESAGRDAVQPVTPAPESGYFALKLADDPVFAEWLSKYTFERSPSFNGIPLISDNAAFDAIPADVKARKEAAEALEDENRFLDAWYSYGEDDNEYIVALKILCLIEDWTDTIMHQAFVLSNLEPGQDLYEYRENMNQTGEKVFWDPVEKAEEYVEQYCDGVMPHIIELALGCYYQDAALTFGDEWIIPLEDTYEISAEYFKKAITAGVYNDYSLFKSVDTFISAGYLSDALAIVHCLEIGEPEYCFHFYQEARTYMIMGEYQKALPCAARGIVYATVPDDVSACAMLMADAFMYDRTDTESALAVMNATKPYMGDMYFMSPVFMTLDILMYAKNRYPGASFDKQIISELNDAFAWECSDSGYLWELTDYFYNYQFIDLGITWIEGILQDYEGDCLAYGNLNFELGQFYLQTADYQKALDCFNAAEESLTEAGAYNAATSNIPYYQEVCNEQLLSQPKKNKA